MEEKEAIEILRKAGCKENVIQHCIAVSMLATRIAERIKTNGFEIDTELVKIGALLHDIGRAKTHGALHWNYGAEILERFNLPPKIVRFGEVHAGTNISTQEARKLGIKEKEYSPKTIEEKVVAYADKLTKVKFNRNEDKWKFIFYEDIKNEINTIKKKKELSKEQKERIISDLIKLDSEIKFMLENRKS
jgi:uncharacterized protein